MDKTIKIPLRRVFEAMKQDPTPKATGVYIEYGENRTAGDNAPRCAMGGAAFVLGIVEPDDLGEALASMKFEDVLEGGTSFQNDVWSWIVDTNDGTKAKKSTVGQRGLKRFADMLDKEVKVTITS